jgi:hypothetical protein
MLHDPYPQKDDYECYGHGLGPKRGHAKGMAVDKN